MSTVVGRAQIELQALTGVAKGQIAAFAAAMRKQLTAAARPVKLGVQVSDKGVDAEVQRVAGKLKSLSSTIKDIVSIDVTALTSVLSLLQKQVADLRAIEQRLGNAPLRGGGNTGGGAGGGSPGSAEQQRVQQLARDLQVVNSQYQRGAVGLKDYLREMARVDSEGKKLAGSLQAGSREAQQLERVFGGLSSNAAKVNSSSIIKLRGDLAGARAEFERATAAAGRFNFSGQRQATQAYEAQLRQLETRIRAVGERSTATQAQLRNLNQLSSQIGSQRNAINGQFTPVSLAGNVQNALKSLPQFAQQIGGSLGAAFTPLQQLTGGMGSLAAAAGPAGIALGAAAVAVTAVGAALKSSITFASGFQQQLADIKALTQPTAAEMGQLKAAMSDIGQPLGVGAKSAADAVLELNKAGLSAKEVIGGGLKGALELAGAAGISAAEASGLLVSSMTAFGLQAKNLSQISDVFANFANKTTLGAGDLAQAVAAVGPVARSSGIDLQQFAGLMATLAQGGFKNMSDAGTSLKTMLLSLSAPSDNAKKYMAALKVTAFDAAGNMKPLTTVVEQMRGSLVKLTPEAQKKVLKEIFGADAIRAAEILMRVGPQAINANTEAMRKQGEAARVARERLDTLKGAGQKFGAAMDQLKIQIGTPFLKPLQGIVEWATRGVQALTNMGGAGQKGLGALPAFARASQQALAPVLGIVQSLGKGVQEVWTRVLQPVLTSLWQIWTVVQTAVVTALGIVLNVVRGVFAAVGGVVKGFVQAFGGQGQAVNFTLAGMAAKVTEWATVARAHILAVGKVAGTLVPVFVGVGVGIGQIIAGIVKTLWALAQGAAAVFRAAGGYALAFLGTLSRFGNGIGQIVKGAVLVFAGFALAVRNALVERVQTALTAGSRMFTVFSEGVGKLLKPAQQAFFTFIVEPLQAAGRFVEAGFVFIVNILQGAVQAAGRILAPLGNALSALGISLGDTLKNAASAASTALTSLISRGADQANAAYEQARKAAQAQASATSTGVGGIIESGLKAAQQGLKDFAKDNGGGALVNQGLSSITQGAKAATTASDGLNASLSATTGKLKTGLSTAGTTLSGAAKDYRAGAATISGAVQGVGTAVKGAMSAANAELARAKTNATATAKAIQDATVTPPAKLASGKTTLDDLGLGDKGGKSKKAPVTAADIVALDNYKKALRGMSEQELKSRLVTAQANNDKEKTRALLAELARREKGHADSLKITGVELVKFRAALKGKTDQQLADLKASDRVKGTAAALSAVMAEQARRAGVQEAQEKRAAAAAKVAADQRANLVREMRQSISVFALQDKQNKVTQNSQLRFVQTFEDFRAKVNKLPPALQKGTEALFDQAKALAASSTAHMKVSGAIKLGGAALGEYKDSIRAMSDEVLKGTLEDEKKTGNLQKQSIILAEIKRRTHEKAEADKKAAAEAERHSASAAKLELRVKHLNEDFALQVKQGRVTAQSLQDYQQKLEGIGADLEKLPEVYRANTTALIENGAALVTQGQQVVDHKGKIDELRQSVEQLTFAELTQMRATETDPEKIKILDAQIKKFKQLSDAQADQAHAESLLSQASADTSGIQAQYDARKAAARGNLAELYQIELEFGGKLAAAQNAEADAQATRDAASVSEKYAKLLELEGISDDRRRTLEADRDRELGAIESKRQSTRIANLAAADNAEKDAKEALDKAIIGIDRQTRDTIRKNNLESLQRRTADVEAQLADEVSAEDLTQVQIADIRTRFLPLLKTAKENEIKEARAIELQAEQDRFDDAVTEAQARLGVSQAFLDAKTKLEGEHRSNVAAINKRLDDEERDYGIKLQQEISRARASAAKADAAQRLQDAKDVVSAQTGNLDDLTLAERKAARAVLDTWKTTYAALGDAGKAAVAEIQKGLDRLDAADKKARGAAGRSIVDPKRLGDSTADKLARIKTPDSALAASEQAVARYAELLTSLQDGLDKAQEDLKEFEGIADEALTPDEKKVKAGLQATVTAYQQQIPIVQAAASDAGTAAATAFTQAQADNAAESALALAEINYELAQLEGRDGGPAYIAGLRAAIAYWKGRLIGMDQGAKEYADILKKIADLDGKIRSASTDPIVGRIESLSKLVGTGGKLQSGIKAGLDGLAAYFKAGGAKGGSKSIIAAASALVAGLGEVFKTGDEDIDQVINTFVSGVQATLGALAKGDWIGAIIAGATTLVMTIGDIFRGGANSAKKAAQEIADATKDIKFFDMSKYARTVSRGGFWGFLGFKKSEIDKEALDIAKNLGDAIYTAITTAMLDGVRQGKATFAELGLDLKAALADQILQGLIEGFLKGAVMQGILQPFLDAYIAAMKTGDANALAAAAEGINRAAVTANQQLARFYETVIVPTSKNLGIYGKDAPKDAPAPGAQDTLGITNVDVKATATIDFDVLKTLATVVERAAPRIESGGQAIQTGAGVFGAQVDRLDRILSSAEMRPNLRTQRGL